ncbi:hypothetical protein ACTQ49_03990 [Luteococcus sp. Sow4_B9]|uniref:hypothetical protein n=1 Tax=Luteococcus sp. Sow4_B9 TaxID=3438792 RepID=UPI003F9A7E3F
MSALLAPLEQIQERAAARAGAPPLRPVPASAARLSRVAFIIFLLGLLGAGMVGVLLLNTAIQQRSATVTQAQREAEDLGHQQASLTARVEQLRSSSGLAEKAWEIGLRPNPHPVFVQLDADGKGGRVVGEPTRVSGAEMPNQHYRSADEVTVAMEKAREARRAQIENERKARLARIEAAKKAAAAQAAEQKRLAAQKQAEQKQAEQKQAGEAASGQSRPAQDAKKPQTSDTANASGGRTVDRASSQAVGSAGGD